VSDGRECNTVKLLVEEWRGLWMESGAQECERIQRIFAARLADGQLELQQTSVSAENIDRLIASARVAAAGERFGYTSDAALERSLRSNVQE
jgi:hypothetical protein